MYTVYCIACIHRQEYASMYDTIGRVNCNPYSENIDQIKHFYENKKNIKNLIEILAINLF